MPTQLRRNSPFPSSFRCASTRARCAVRSVRRSSSTRTAGCVTAAHMLEPLDVHRQHIAGITAFDADVGHGRTDTHDDELLIRNTSIWLGRDDWSIETFRVLAGAALQSAASNATTQPWSARIRRSAPGFDPERSERLQARISLSRDHCNLRRGSRRLQPHPRLAAIPRFPNEGIITRFLHSGREDGIAVKLIETSTPGLRGRAADRSSTSPEPWSGCSRRRPTYRSASAPRSEVDGTKGDRASVSQRRCCGSRGDDGGILRAPKVRIAIA